MQKAENDGQKNSSMKRLILAFLGTLASITLYAQMPSADALQLAARRVEHRQADIPNDLALQIEAALEALRQSSDEKALEVQRHGIKAYPQVNTESLDIWLAENSALAEAYLADPQAYTSLSPYLEPYGLTVKNVSNKAGSLVLHVEANYPVNMRFLADELSMNLEIDMVEVPMPKHRQTDITARMLNGGDWVLHYHLFFDQSSFEEGYHVWEFNYSKENGLQFVAEYGADAPQTADLQKPQNSDKS